MHVPTIRGSLHVCCVCVLVESSSIFCRYYDCVPGGVVCEREFHTLTYIMTRRDINVLRREANCRTTGCSQM